MMSHLSMDPWQGHQIYLLIWAFSESNSFPLILNKNSFEILMQTSNFLHLFG